MYTRQEIILQYYREGKSQRSISQELGISRKTVSSYISSYLLYCESNGHKESNLRDFLLQEPKYNSQNRLKVKLTESVITEIKAQLKLNEKRKSEGFLKQIQKNKDIWELLISKGFDISYSTVCNYIRSTKSKSSNTEVFIRQCYQPAESCEFDWGEVKLVIAGELKKFNLAVFTSTYSNYRFALLYERQDTLAFMESHREFFAHIKGVYKEMVYDNMRVAVAKFVGKHEKEPTESLLSMRSHYHFSHRFCNLYKGNEKGHVERSVELIRRKAFSLKTEYSDLKQAQEQLLGTIEKINSTQQQLTGKSAKELFEDERTNLLANQLPMHCSLQSQSRVDKYCTISYKTNRYSVPEELSGKILDLNISSHTIDIFHENKQVATHQRSYGLHDWVIKIDHYLETFKKKPGALIGSQALAQNSYFKSLFLNHFKENVRDFIDLLIYCKKESINTDKLSESLLELEKSNIKIITSEKIIALLGNKAPEPIPNLEDEIMVISQNQLSETASLMNL